MEFMTTKEAEKKWNISERRIRRLLKDGRIIGATKLGNSWSIPTTSPKPIDKRSLKQEARKIVVDLKQIDLTNIEKNKKKLQVKEINNNLLIEWIYHANKLNGNSLTKEEIKIVINNITVAGKTITEHLEIINYNSAINYIIESLNKKEEITENELKNIHRLITKNIDNENAGVYRNENFSNKQTPDYQLIPEIIKKIITNYNESIYHLIIKAIILHSELLRILPFKNNNQKTALLVLNLILLSNEYYPIIITDEYQKEYLSQIEISHITGNYTELIKLILEIEEKELVKELKLLEGSDKV